MRVVIDFADFLPLPLPQLDLLADILPLGDDTVLLDPRNVAIASSPRAFRSPGAFVTAWR